MPSKHQTISPSRPLTVEIPTGLDATMASTACSAAAAAAAATEADIKLGERTAFIPMTCQERQVLDRLEAGLQAAAGLWRESQQQQEHDRLLSLALHHWRAAGAAVSGGVDTSWVWEVGRWNTQFSLPFALELRRLDPSAMSDSDHLVALSTCLRNRQIELARKLASGGVGCGGKKKSATAQTVSCLEDLDDEPCLCQIRWGLAPDTEAAKRRQLEKLDDEAHSSPVEPHQKRPHHQHQPQQKHRPQPPSQHQQPPAAAASLGQRRPIVKTSHLREQSEPRRPVATTVAEDAGYASQNCSPPGSSRPAGGFINDLLASSVRGGRCWAD